MAHRFDDGLLGNDLSSANMEGSSDNLSSSEFGHANAWVYPNSSIRQVSVIRTILEKLELKIIVRLDGCLRDHGEQRSSTFSNTLPRPNFFRLLKSRPGLRGL